MWGSMERQIVSAGALAVALLLSAKVQVLDAAYVPSNYGHGNNNPSSYDGGYAPPAYGDSYGYQQETFCSNKICKQYEEVQKTVCTKYETGCAKECKAYKTNYYATRGEAHVEYVDVCLDVETYQLTQCVEFEKIHVQACAEFETKTVQSCRRFEKASVAQCKAYEIKCYDECCEYEVEQQPYCTKREIKFYWGKGGHGEYGGYGPPPPPPTYAGNHSHNGSSYDSYGEKNAIVVDCNAHPNDPLCLKYAGGGGHGNGVIDCIANPNHPMCHQTSGSYGDGDGDGGYGYGNSHNNNTYGDSYGDGDSVVIDCNAEPNHPLCKKYGGDDGNYGDYRRETGGDTEPVDESDARRQAWTPADGQAFYERQRQQNLAGASGGGASTHPVYNSTWHGSNTTYNGTNWNGTNVTYGSPEVVYANKGEFVVLKKIPPKEACCKPYCAEYDLAVYPSRKCKKRQPVCYQSDTCKEYKYIEFDTDKCIEYTDVVVKTGTCIKPETVTIQTGKCIHYEKMYYTNGRCQKWGKLKYVSDQAPVIHVSYPTDECDTYKPDAVCWQTPNCIQTETVSFPSNNCLVWAECEAPSYPPPTSYGPAYNSYGGGKGGTVYKRRDAGSDDSVSGAPRDAGAAPADSASQIAGSDSAGPHHSRSRRGAAAPGYGNSYGYDQDQDQEGPSVYDEEWPINTDGQSVKHMMFDQTDHHQGEPLPPLPAPLRVTVDAPVVGQLAGEQGAADYKYYDTGMGLYNNFAYQGGVRHPEPEGNGGPHGSYAFSQWIQRVKNWREETGNYATPYNPYVEEARTGGDTFPAQYEPEAYQNVVPPNPNLVQYNRIISELEVSLETQQDEDTHPFFEVHPNEGMGGPVVRGPGPKVGEQNIRYNPDPQWPQYKKKGHNWPNPTSSSSSSSPAPTPIPAPPPPRPAPVPVNENQAAGGAYFG